MKKNNFIASAILSILLISLSIAVGYIVIYNPVNLDLRNWATGSKLETRLINSSEKVKPNQAFTVDFEVNTKGRNYSGIQMAGTISGVDQDKSNLIVSQPAGLNPIFTSVTKDGNNLKFKFIDFSSTITPFNSNDNFVKLATLSLYPKGDGEVIITLDGNESGGVEYGQEFNQSSVNKISYNIDVDEGTGGTSAPPDQGIHRSCNEYCADSRECEDKYSCYYNRCRNPKNLTEETCADPIIIQPTPIVTTTTTNVSTTSQAKGETVEPTPTTATSSTIANVIITSATTSSTQKYLVATPSPSPSATPIISKVDEATPATRKVTKLGSNNPSPTPQVQTQAKKSNSILPFLIGAAIITGIGGIIAIIFIIRNLQNRD